MTKRRHAPLHLAFIWNMHQPFYKDLESSQYLLPWTRLHGIKDYYGMVHILRQFPHIHQTFNLVPSLLKQIQDYTQQELKQVKEKSLQLTLKAATELTKEDKVFLLYHFFMANWPHMVYPHPRYAELLEKRGTAVTLEELEKIQAYFSSQEYLDLQIWGNLSWIDPFFQSDPRIQDLLKRGANFREKDKLPLLEVQQEIMGLIVPEHLALAQSGQIELCTSPLYHPILPLLCDSKQALAALPDLKLPTPDFVHPEDARAQIEKGIATFKEITGITPQGMWPSEGSVSEQVIPLIARAGIKWIATDEQILAKSLDLLLERDSANGVLKEPKLLYQPYLLERGDQQLSIIFRDHMLSDLIGFVYSPKEPKEAAQDFIQRLLDIKDSLPARGNYLVPILLDGENAWEYYSNNGRDFLCFLYEGLTKEPLLKTVTVSEYLAQNPAKKRLGKLFSGSWINHNFKIWIGDEEDNRAWEQINMTREVLLKYQEDNPDADPILLQKAWEEIYIAEGSDWFWWYGEEHNSANDETFDSLFRQQLINVYNMLGLEVPKRLYISNIIEERHCLPKLEAKGFLNPVIDGKITDYYEWLVAGHFDVSKGCSSLHQAMHQNVRFINALYYGFNLENLFLRVDFSGSWIEDLPACSFYLNFLQPKEWCLELQQPAPGNISTQLRRRSYPDDWQTVPSEVKAGLDKILEIQLPLAPLGVKSGDELSFTFSVEKEGLELERWPGRGYIILSVPGEDFEDQMWQV